MPSLMPSRGAIALAAILAALWGGWLARGTYERAQTATALERALAARTMAEKELVAAADAVAAAESARLAAESDRDEMARRLEDAANADNDTRGGLPAQRVQRLRNR